MARGTSLGELTQELRVELGRASNVAVGPGDIPMLQRVLRRMQKMLWNNYDWPFLRQAFPLIPLAAGQRMYDPPANLDTDRIESAAVWYGGRPMPITRGIGWDEYQMGDPETRTDPVQRWDIRTDDQFHTQVEVWPTPASNSYELQFIGIRNLRPLVADQDLCDLDDDLIILFAAAQILARQKSADAPVVQEAATAYLQKLRAKADTGVFKRVRIGMGDGASARRSPTQVLVAGYAPAKNKGG
jgi:hypothetical protein